MVGENGVLLGRLTGALLRILSYSQEGASGASCLLVNNSKCGRPLSSLGFVAGLFGRFAAALISLVCKLALDLRMDSATAPSHGVGHGPKPSIKTLAADFTEQ